MPEERIVDLDELAGEDITVQLGKGALEFPVPPDCPIDIYLRCQELERESQQNIRERAEVTTANLQAIADLPDDLSQEERNEKVKELPDLPDDKTPEIVQAFRVQFAKLARVRQPEISEEEWIEKLRPHIGVAGVFRFLSRIYRIEDPEDESGEEGEEGDRPTEPPTSTTKTPPSETPEKPEASRSPA